MARKGQSAAFLKALRRKHGLGEYAGSRKQSKRARIKRRANGGTSVSVGPLL